MTALMISIVGAAPAADTAAPAIVLRLRIDVAGVERVHAMVLRCHTSIDARRRRYSADEHARLYELFGDASQWDRALHSLTWAQSSLVVPSFEQRTEVDLPVACTYDLEVGSSKYLHAVRAGEIPITILFSGTIFVVQNGTVSAEPVSWDLEASYRLPEGIWRTTMDRFFPGGGWIRLQRDTIDRLQTLRGRYAVVTWDELIELLLQPATPQQVV